MATATQRACVECGEAVEVESITLRTEGGDEHESEGAWCNCGKMMVKKPEELSWDDVHETVW